MIGMKAVTTQENLVHFACDVKYESMSKCIRNDGKCLSSG